MITTFRMGRLPKYYNDDKFKAMLDIHNEARDEVAKHKASLASMKEYLNAYKALPRKPNGKAKTARAR